jgi:hypothetical protein
VGQSFVAQLLADAEDDGTTNAIVEDRGFCLAEAEPATQPPVTAAMPAFDGTDVAAVGWSVVT